MTAAHAKFLFDTEFEAPSRRAGGTAGRRAAELAAAREDGRREGIAEGRRQAETEIGTRVEARLAEFAERAGAFLDTLAGEREKLAGEAATLALASARALAPALVAREPHGELMALFEECIGHLARAPHIVVRVPDGEPARLRERLDEIARRAGFEGRIVVLREDDMESGDCRVEWADGGIERDFGAIAARIHEAVERRYGRTGSDTGAPAITAVAGADGETP